MLGRGPGAVVKAAWKVGERDGPVCHLVHTFLYTIIYNANNNAKGREH